MSPDSVLTVRHAQKHFGAVHALKDVSLEAYAGEVLALLGDNGAGKSTLVKCISGVHALDAGEILVDGEVVAVRSPAAARRAGIETVYQDLALFDNLTPAQRPAITYIETSTPLTGIPISTAAFGSPPTA